MLDLNEQFKKALHLITETNQNVFITGKAGTGKSTLLSYCCEQLPKAFAVLAPTGVAALNVGGETIHSFFRFQPGITMEEARKKGSKARNNELYTKTKTIIIDEISMVRADLLDCVDVFLKAACVLNKPFGGIQMIFIGDLYQLPPVVTREDEDFFAEAYESPYFFDSNVFRQQNFQMEFVELEKIYRQKDSDFIELLNAVRTNTIQPNHIETLNKRLTEDFEHKKYEDFIRLTTTNAEAKAVNEFRLRALKGKPQVFEGQIKGEVDMKQLPTEMELLLKVGARIMFVNNDSGGRWVNGTLGHVTEMTEEGIVAELDDGTEVEVGPNTWEVFKYLYDKSSKSLSQESLGSFTQIPVRLAWAITIHKSQGKTFDQVMIDLGRDSFASGQTYVALSRCRTFEGIVLKKPVKKSDIRIDWRVQKFLTRSQYDRSEEALPFQEKLKMIEHAIVNNLALEISYLKQQDVKSKRKITPKHVGEQEYLGKKFVGVEAWCHVRQDMRVFRVDRILEMKVM